MFEKILLAVDGSEESEKAVPLTAAVATKFGSEVIVLHIREHEFGRMGGLPMESAEQAQDIAHEVVSKLANQGVKARPEVRGAIHGRAAQEILDVATAEGAALIAMGSRGLSEFSAVLIGSVTNKVLHLAQVPVLVAR